MTCDITGSECANFGGSQSGNSYCIGRSVCNCAGQQGCGCEVIAGSAQPDPLACFFVHVSSLPCIPTALLTSCLPIPHEPRTPPISCNVGCSQQGLHQAGIHSWPDIRLVRCDAPLGQSVFKLQRRSMLDGQLLLRRNTRVRSDELRLQRLHCKCLEPGQRWPVSFLSFSGRSESRPLNESRHLNVSMPRELTDINNTSLPFLNTCPSTHFLFFTEIHRLPAPYLWQRCAQPSRLLLQSQVQAGLLNLLGRHQRCSLVHGHGGCTQAWARRHVWGSAPTVPLLEEGGSLASQPME